MAFHQLGDFELQEIFSWLPSDDICRILICGCQSLNERIFTRVGVRKLTIVLRQDFRKRTWPSLVDQFQHIDALEIEDLGYRYVDPFKSEHLLGLRSRPTVLRIFGNLAVRAFADSVESDSSRYNNMRSLTLLSNTESSLTAKAIAWPPNLTFLKVSAAYTALDLRQLPSTLTHLSGEFQSLKEDSESYPFPPSLTTLDVKILLHTPISVLHRLPSGSTILQTLHINNSITDDQGFASLFPALDCSDAKEIFSAIPPNVTSLRLKLHRWLQIPAHLLPKHLKHVSGIFSNHIFSKETFAALPETLYDFCPQLSASDFSDQSLEQNTGSENLNNMIERRGIRYMRLCPPPQGIYFPPETAVNLPTTITRLTISYQVHTLEDVRWSLEGPIILPLGLLSLVVSDGYEITQRALESGLPPNLLTLKHNETLENAECFKLLPKTMTSLDAMILGRSYANEFPTESSRWLPPALTRLSLGPIAITSLQWFSGLPKTLTDFEVSLCVDSSAVTVPEHSLDPIEFPPLITELRIYFKAGFHQIERIFEHLPRKLQTLRIEHESDAGITDRFVSALPRTLFSILLTDRDNFTENCIPYLPPRLQYLTFGFAEPAWFAPGRSVPP